MTKPHLVVIDDRYPESIWTNATDWLKSNVSEYGIKWIVLTPEEAKEKAMEISKDKIYIKFDDEQDAMQFRLTWS